MPPRFRDKSKATRAFALSRVVLVGDRAMLTEKQIAQLKQHPELGWISALKAGAIPQLVEARTLQLFPVLILVGGGAQTQARGTIASHRKRAGSDPEATGATQEEDLAQGRDRAQSRPSGEPLHDGQALRADHRRRKIPGAAPGGIR